jgi:hypothetical protein
MAYTNYSDNEIFDDAQLNMLCNAIINYVIEDLEVDASDFVLSGSAAAVLQGATVIDPRVVPFVTAQSSVFNAFSDGFAQRFPDFQVIKLNNVVYFSKSNYLFELWLLTTVKDETFNNIKVQNSTQIPNNLLNAVNLQ